MDENRYDEFNNEQNNEVEVVNNEEVINNVENNTVENGNSDYNVSNDSESNNENNNVNRNPYSNNPYNSNPYTNGNNYNSYGYNKYGYNNYNNMPPKKNNNSSKKKIAIAACIVAGLAIIGGSAIFFKGFADFMDRYGNNNPSSEIAWDKDADKNGEKKEEEAISTTAPVSITNGTSNAGVVTDVSGIVEAVMPSVVSITSTSSVEGYSIFGQRYEQQISSAGTGFIVGENDKELLFATNNHVVEDATAIQVTFCDEETAEAIVKGTDAQADLAVVAVNKKDIKEETKTAIKVALLGDSDEVKVGQLAIAIGNAQGMGQSVTVGYISAKDRKLDMGESAEDNSKSMSFIQTDAAINGGNSGGPLIDINGNVVGINSAKISDTAVEGMCYAIPISTAIPIINELMNRETLTDEERGYLGVALQDISAEAIEMYNVPDGVYVGEVTANGPAAKAGIKKGDIITEINGVSVNTRSAASDKINSYRVGTELNIVVYRQGEMTAGYEKIEIKATLGTAEEAGVELKGQNENNKNGGKSENDGNGEAGGNDGYSYPEDDYNNQLDNWFNDMFPW